jgi:hypothetical protein
MFFGVFLASCGVIFRAAAQFVLISPLKLFRGRRR